VTDAIYSRVIPEPNPSPEHRLGRHVEHDPRSRAYAYNTAGLKVTPVYHQRHVPIFDQGDLGACTGNAAVGCLATDPFDPVMLTEFPNLNLGEALAVKVYELATTLDDIEGQYPPNDTGSSGIAAAKALQQNGWIAGYQHTFALEDMLKALAVTPVMIGINWYDSFDQPDSAGVIQIKKGAQVRGGHELYLDEIAVNKGKYYCGGTNSWTVSWGLEGRFYMPFSTVEQLLGEEGDVTVPVPLTSPAPTPGPSGPSGPSGSTGPSGPSGSTGSSGPTPSPEDVELWADIQRWAKTKGLA
jgi:hypothetical protein